MTGASERRAPDLGAAMRLGVLMQRRRDALGLSQRELADRLSLERSGVSQFETGARVPSREVMHRWYIVFGQVPEVARLHAAALAERGHARRGRQHDRHAHEGTATHGGIRDHASSTTSATLAPEAADVQRDQFLALTGSALAGMLTAWPERPARISMATVAELDQVTDAHRRLYHSLSSGELIGAVTGHLDTVLSLLRGRPAEPVRQRLAAIACETAGHAAWLAHDRGNHATAEHYYAIAAATGREADDSALNTYVYGFLSQVRSDQGRRREALELVQGARATAQTTATATTRAWLAGLEAVALAAVGEAKRCTTALNAAEHLLGTAQPAEDPGWQYRFDMTRFLVMTGGCQRRLGNLAVAERMLHEALGALEGSLRRRSEVLSELAHVHLDRQDVDQACGDAGHALDGAVTAGSVAGVRQVSRFRTRLARWGDTAAVVSLDQQLVAAL